ncbi:hypothetical protein PGB90_009768 [Kerria lacca]
MKTIIQRVSNASVTVDGEVISSIGTGLCILIGICREDTEKDINYIIQKILKLKLFENDERKKWSSSVVDKKYEILCVSQFTLYYSLKGNKLDFHHAMPFSESKPLYDKFLQSLRSQYKTELIKDGKFGASMVVDIVNDGPVTIQIESPKLKIEIDTESADSNIDNE